ncbi:anoctamin-4 [Fopius arisanus]|uniref:Anoctamin n=1 Tax=Fopius arisanus TaxID=64838 RepID=A0A0C9REX8_9HYME|nr:PREDICTED: anoctamin-4 [Fopius arisanus]
MSITHDEGFDESVVAREDNVLRLQLALPVIRNESLLPPSPGHLPGCSPSYFTCSSPFPFREEKLVDDKLLHENEIQKTHSRRPSTSFLPRIVEPLSPSKSQLSDFVRSIGTPDVSLASTSGSRGSSPGRSATEEDVVVGSLRDEMPLDVAKLEAGLEAANIVGREILYQSDKNGFKRKDDTGSSPRPKKTSVPSVFPVATGLVAVRDAFGPKLTPAISAANSLPESPQPEEDTFNPEDPSTQTHKQNGVAGDGDSGETDHETLFFRDGRRRIDMVLVYQEETEGVMTEIESKRREQRRIFQENLLKEGLQMELEPKENSFDGKTFFLKIHIPWKIKVQYAEVMNLKLLTKRFITISVKAWGDDATKIKKKFWEKWSNFLSFLQRFHMWDTSLYPEEPNFYATHDSGDREERFLVKDRETAYTPAQRSLIVYQILMRARYDETHEKAGIRRLIADGTYIDCFCLHEGPYNRPGPDGVPLDRHLLYLIWARPSQWYKKQPLWLIRRYFGEKVALYYAWLGFYTRSLYLPAIVGLLCFVYGLSTMESTDNIPSKEICDPEGPGNITLCPLCDKACDYRKLKESCLFSRLTYLFDNPATVFFAIFMSFWATSFLELWKRRQAVIVWEWDLQNVDGDEEPRPEFETSVKTFRINPVTREREPYMPAYSRAWRYCVTGSLVFFMICVVLGAVLGTIIYRISLVAVVHSGGGSLLQRHAKIFTSMTAALINLIIIMILTRIYQKLAKWMVNMENPRTQTEYEDSFTFKIFFFEFVNFYSSLIYIAFFKGRFYVHPGDADARSSEFFRIKTDVCDPAGCLSELCIQLAIIMVGKQCFNNFMEILSPKMVNWWRKRTHVAATKDHERPYTYWEQDYQLQDPGRLALFDEYLEMILQYGFVTLFVAAFPLAPLFALLNNIGEIRLDAYKMVKEARRPLAERVEDIGAWYGILKGVTYAAVVSNAFVIAYTSDFIPRSVYAYVYSKTNDLQGYIDSSLSDFNTSHYSEDMIGNRNGPPICQYRGYRNGPAHSDPYGLSPQYWHVFASRLAFVVCFEHMVFALTGLMSYVIPETPSAVSTQLSREKLLAQEAKYEKGVKGREDEDELLSVLREAGNFGRPGARRGSWARRFSKLSDTLDAHIDVGVRQQRASDASTLWEASTHVS